MAIKEFKVNVRSFRAADLTVPEYNPRKDIHDDPEFYEELYNSLVELGYINVIVVNIKDGKNIIVGGNQRYKTLCDIAEQEGFKKEDTYIDALVVEFDVVKEKTANLALNNIEGDWVQKKLKEQLDFLKSQDEEMFRVSGFDDEDLANLTPSPEIEEEMKIKDFRLSVRLPLEYEDLYDFYVSVNGEDKFKKEIMKILGGADVAKR